MLPGMNQRQMAHMMRRMGISQQDIDATEVIIRTKGKELIFSNPQVSKVNMMSQNTFQIIGEPAERQISAEPELNDEDVKTVMEQASVTEDVAEKAIKDNGFDLAKAIMSLQKQ